MRRRLLIIAAFLLAGAVVNVAVAWGCAAWSRNYRAGYVPGSLIPQYVGSEEPATERPLPVPHDWPPPEHKSRGYGFGVDRLDVYWGDLACPPRLGRWYCSIENTEAGWPVLCQNSAYLQVTRLQVAERLVDSVWSAVSRASGTVGWRDVEHSFPDVARGASGLDHRRFGLLRTLILDSARGGEQGFESLWGHAPLRKRMPIEPRRGLRPGLRRVARR